MTCIVGLEHDGKVYMGGDSAAVGGMDVYPSRIPKVFQAGRYLIGYTTSFRMGQLLQYGLDKIARKRKKHIRTFSDRVHSQYTYII